MAKKEKRINVVVKAKMSLAELRNAISAIEVDAYNTPADTIVTQLKAILDDASRADDNSVTGLRLQQSSLEKHGDEHCGPEDILYAVRVSPKSLFDDSDEEIVELHMCFIWEWYFNNQVYPTKDMGMIYAINDLPMPSELGEMGDSDGSVFYWHGSESIEKIKKAMKKNGFKEQPSLLDDYDYMMDRDRERWENGKK